MGRVGLNMSLVLGAINPALIFLAFLGGLAHAVIWAQSFAELRSYGTVRTVIIGLIVGFLYDQLHSGWSFPNGVMAFVAGWMGIDFIEGIVDKFRPKPKP